MKHTKGKWQADLISDSVKTEDGELICIVAYLNKKRVEERKANAKLISKAPEMYEALMMAMSCIIKHGSPELVDKYESLLKEIES
jgi:hypothetical protein